MNKSLLSLCPISLILFALFVGGSFSADACSRVVMVTDSAQVVMVGRTLDWRTPIPTNIYLYPQGITKHSMPSGPALHWTSRYATILAVSYDGGATEGMNEAGLVMNGLFCNVSRYPAPVEGDTITPVMPLSLIVSFFLDNFATVSQVDDWLEHHHFVIPTSNFDGGTSTLLHWALTDISGDNLIMEYVDGRLTTYRGKDLLVLTNNPIYTDMQAINAYWNDVGGVNMLPGTVRSADRFVRGSFFISHVPHHLDSRNALASLSSIMANLSVPWLYQVEGKPHLSSTQWRSIADLTEGRYYFRLADTLSDFYIEFKGEGLSPGSPVKKLTLTNLAPDQLSGRANTRLIPSKPFTPIR